MSAGTTTPASGLAALARLPRPVWTLLGASALLNTGSGLVRPYLVVYLHSTLGFDLLVISGAYSLTAVAAVVGGLLAGRCADGVGAARAFAAFAALSAVANLGYALVGAPWQALGAATLFGIGLGGNAAFAAALATATPPADRATAFGANFAVINAATALGSVAGGLVVDEHDPSPSRLLYVVFAACALGAGAITLRAARGGAPAPEGAADPGRHDAPGPHGGYRELLGDRRLLALMVPAVLLYLVAYGQFESGLPALVIAGTALGPVALSTVFGVNTVAVVVAQLGGAGLLRSLREGRALVAAAVLWLVSWLLFAGMLAAGGTAGPLTLLAAGAAVFAVAECLLGAALPAALNALAPDRLRGRYNAVHSAAMSVGMTLGPLIGGSLIGAGAFRTYVAVMVTGCVLGALGFAATTRAGAPATAGVTPDPAEHADIVPDP